MRTRDRRGPLIPWTIGIDTIALQGCLAPGEQPVGPRRPFTRQGIQHRAFMVAHQVDHLHARDRAPGHQPGDHTSRIGAAIDVVADMQQQRGRDRAIGQVVGDSIVQGGQLAGASMDVTNGVDTAARGQGGRRLR